MAESDPEMSGEDESPKIIVSLNALKQRVDKVWSAHIPKERTFLEQFNYGYPALYVVDIVEIIDSVSHRIRKMYSDEGYEADDGYWDKTAEQVDQLTFANFPSDPANWIRSTIEFLFWLSQAVPPLAADVDWLKVSRDHIPKQVFERLQGLDERVRGALENSEKISDVIREIEAAHEAADRLPTNLQELRSTSEEIRNLLISAKSDVSSIEKVTKQVEAVNKIIEEKRRETEAIAKQCQVNFNNATSEGLAGAFSDRSRSLVKTGWAWVAILIASLGAGTYIAGGRFQALLALLAQSSTIGASVDRFMIIVQLLAAFMGLGAAVWVGWVSTKNINQSFKLAEDYAFKASISKAYQGYRQEAIDLQGDFLQRLFGSALTRLDEAPIRLLNEKDHATPLEALLENKAFSEIVKAVPNLQQRIGEMVSEGKASVAAVSAAIAAATTTASTSGAASSEENSSSDGDKQTT